MERPSSRERESIDSLVLEMRPKVHLWVRTHYPRRTDHDDLEQAALLALLAAAGRYVRRVNPAPFPAYAWPRVRGAVADEIRRQRPSGYRKAGKMAPGEVVPRHLAMHDLADELAAPDRDADVLRDEAIAAEVARLPMAQRLAISAVYFDDVAPIDLARALGISVSAMESRLREARANLRRRLGAGPARS